MFKRNKKKIIIATLFILPISLIGSFFLIKPSNNDSSSAEISSYATGSITNVQQSSDPSDTSTSTTVIEYEYDHNSSDTEIYYRYWEQGGTVPSGWMYTPAPTADGTYEIQINNLMPDRTYEFEMYISNGVESSAMASTTFTTDDQTSVMTITNLDSSFGNDTDGTADNIDITFDYSISLNEGLGDIEYRLVVDNNGNNYVDSGDENITVGNTTNVLTYTTDAIGMDGNTSGSISLVADWGYSGNDTLPYEEDLILEFWVDGIKLSTHTYLISTPNPAVVDAVNISGVGDYSADLTYRYTRNDGSANVEYRVLDDSDADGQIDDVYQDWTLTVPDESVGGDRVYSMTISGLQPVTEYKVEFRVDTMVSGSATFTTTAPFNPSVIDNLTISNQTIDANGNVDADISFDMIINEGVGNIDYRLWLDSNNNGVIEPAADVQVTVGGTLPGGWNPMTSVDGNEGTYNTSLSALGYVGANKLKPNTNYIIQFRADGLTYDTSDYVQPFKTAKSDEISNINATVNYNTNTANITYTYTPFDGTGGNVQYQVKNETTGGTVITPWTTTPATETTAGTYSLQLSGLTYETTYSIEFRIDMITQPTYTLVYQTPDSLTVDQSSVIAGTHDASFEIDYTDNSGPGKVEYKVNTGGWKIFPYTLVDGNNLIEIEKDDKMLQSNSTYQFYFRVDGIQDPADTITINTLDNGAEITSAQAVNVTSTSADITYTVDINDGYGYVEYSWDNGEYWNEATGGVISFTNILAGKKYVITLRVDQQNDQTTWETVTFTTPKI